MILINIFLNKIKIIYDEFIYKIKWRRKNKHNFTNIRNIFPLEHVVVGEGTYGGIRVIDYGSDYCLRIGSFCSIADNVTFVLAGEHNLNSFSTFPYLAYYGDEDKHRALSNGNITVGDDVWIGYNATILSGVTIGRGAVIAAGAVVSKDVEPYTIVGGMPAKVIRKRFSDEVINHLVAIDFKFIICNRDFLFSKWQNIELNTDNIDEFLHDIGQGDS